MLERKAPKAGRPKEIKGIGKPTMLYLDETMLSDFKRLCADKYQISASEGLRQLIEQELEKNEVGLNNPTNIPYGLHNKHIYVSGISVNLDKFLDSKGAKKIVEEIPREQIHTAFANSKKIFQQLQLKTEGKITI